MSTQTDTRFHDVIVVGAGPTGLLLAGELAAAGTRPVVLDRATQPATAPKANGVVGRATVELATRNLLRGTGLRVVRPPRFPFGPLTLELGLLRRPLHVLPMPQRRLESLLEDRAVRLGATILRGYEVRAFEQDNDSVTIQATVDASDIELHTRYLVGCDGARSLVRKRLGTAFLGVTSTNISRLARVTIPPAAVSRLGDLIELRGVGRLVLFRPNRTDHGSVTIAPANALDRAAPDDLYIVSTHEPRGGAEPTDELSEDELRMSLRRVLGVDLPFTAAYAARSVVGNSRLAERYRDGRIFLAGDAAHIFSAGGSALNAGLLDAIALGPSLAAAQSSRDPEVLLNSYEAQRRPAAERTLALTRVQATLDTGDETGDALRSMVGEMLKDRATARRIATLIEG